VIATLTAECCENDSAVLGETPSGNAQNKSILYDVNLSLPRLFGLLECAEVGAQELNCLGKTDQERREIQALLALWQSLGRPDSKFWQETKVFYNRIVG
jgi:hypothetical protein